MVHNPIDKFFLTKLLTCCLNFRQQNKKVKTGSPSLKLARREHNRRPSKFTHQNHKSNKNRRSSRQPKRFQWFLSAPSSDLECSREGGLD